VLRPRFVQGNLQPHQDWTDLEEMADNGSLDADRVIATLQRCIGAHDDRTTRLQALIPTA
jgi:hypothetical protein